MPAGAAHPEAEIDGDTAARPGMLLRGWKGIAQVVAMAAVTVGAGFAIYAERSTVRRGVAVLPHLRVGWLVAGIGAELVSMIAFGFLQQSLLRASGTRLTLRSVLGMVYRANAIALAVPVIGSGIATAQLYRDYRRGGGQAAQPSASGRRFAWRRRRR